MKQCSKCKETRPLDEFYKSNKNKSGYCSQCRKCIRARYTPKPPRPLGNGIDKQCSKCKETKSFDEFYKNDQLRDGRFNICIVCTKARKKAIYVPKPPRPPRPLRACDYSANGIDKQCYKCKETKLLGEFGKNNRGKDGLRITCKQCCSEYRRESSQRRRERYLSIPENRNKKDKQCKTCKETKLLSEFHKDKSRKDGIQVYCKECVHKHHKKYYQSAHGKEITRRWQEENKEKMRGYFRKYESKPETIEKRRLRQSKPEYKEKRRLYENSRGIQRRHNYKHDLEYRAKCLVKDSLKRAKKKGLEHNITYKDILPFPETCPVLGTPLTLDTDTRSNSPSIDRIDNSKGYTKDNIQIISTYANALKQDLLAPFPLLERYYE